MFGVRRRVPVMPKMPQWKPPNNVGKALADGEGSWEDARWSPILVTAKSGTEYEGRAIPVAWQIEFDPSEDFTRIVTVSVTGREPWKPWRSPDPCSSCRRIDV